MRHSKFSDTGAQKREEEKVAYIYFMDFLDECESKLISQAYNVAKSKYSKLLHVLHMRFIY